MVIEVYGLSLFCRDVVFLVVSKFRTLMWVLLPPELLISFSQARRWSSSFSFLSYSAWSCAFRASRALASFSFFFLFL